VQKFIITKQKPVFASFVSLHSCSFPYNSFTSFMLKIPAILRPSSKTTGYLQKGCLAHTVSAISPFLLSWDCFNWMPNGHLQSPAG